MFLTGFDSKPLSVLYVDKELQYHTLLQAYSRTNRVEKETKPFGIIICYRNLKQRTDEALALFSKSPKPFDGIVTPGFDFYVNKFNEYALKLKEIAPFPENVDTMQSEDDQRKFIIAFRELTKYLQSLRTFVEFSFDKSAIIMPEQEYEDYKSKYLILYRNAKNARNVASVLNDVDFCIELMESDRINVAYIMNLIRNLTFDNQKKKDEEIEHIKAEIDRTDNPQLRKKSELLKNFLDSIVIGLESVDEVDAAYNDFENDEKRKEIEAFAKEQDVSADLIAEFVAEFEFSGVISVGSIRDRIDKPMPLLRKISLSNRVTEFILSLTDKYQ
jgi:type I restriction enzyme R subunit